MKKVFTFLLALIVLGGSSCIFAYNYVISLATKPLIYHGSFRVNQGSNFNLLVDQLTGEKQNYFRVRAFAYLHPELINIKTGLYDMTTVDNLQQALEIINSGNGQTTNITLVPGKTWDSYEQQFTTISDISDDIQGLNTLEVIKLLNLKPLAGDQNFNNLEGYFSPNTYKIALYTPVSAVLKLSNDRLEQQVLTAWEHRNERCQAKTPYELLILASLIQKEKGNDAEAYDISAVFNNRLARGMKLQSDPTVIYGLGSKYTGNITTKDLQTPTPYNTYTIPGLPPTPISMVDDNSLEAAAQPSKVSYLYFVAVYGKGKHVFANTYAEQSNNVRNYVNAYRKANSTK